MSSTSEKNAKSNCFTEAEAEEHGLAEHMFVMKLENCLSLLGSLQTMLVYLVVSWAAHVLGLINVDSLCQQDRTADGFELVRVTSDVLAQFLERVVV